MTERPKGTHWDPYKRDWVRNLTQEEVDSMWPNAKPAPVVVSTKRDWRARDAEEVNARRFPMEAAQFNEKGELLDVPELPRRMIGPNDNAFPPDLKLRLEEEAYVNAAVHAAVHKSDGGSSDYYTIPMNAKDLQDLIEYKRMEFGMANIFKACYRFGEKSGTDKRYDLNKIIWFANRELARLGGEG